MGLFKNSFFFLRFIFIALSGEQECVSVREYVQVSQGPETLDSLEL